MLSAWSVKGQGSNAGVRTMPAYYRSTVDAFLRDDTAKIVGRLTLRSARSGFYQQQHAQTEAWRVQIAALAGALRAVEGGVLEAGGQILLEYPIPRRGKRVDAVLLANGLVIAIEFKCGATGYATEAVRQIEDYCLDLRDFHEASRGRVLVPLLVCTEAPDRPEPAGAVVDSVAPVWCANAATLGRCLSAIVRRYDPADGVPVDPVRWDRSNYLPTPTIIEAAQALYAGQNVREISRCHAGAHNLTRTSEAVIGAIETARRAGRKLLCFITGVPGAGKTLAGLNIVHNHDLHEGDLGVFLSGNGPLVKVLREALARDHAARTGTARAEARRRVGTFVQNVHRFIDAYYAEPGKVPPDRVVVFDEAQRAWDADQSRRKFKRPHAEAEIMLDVMDRHRGWAVIVALIGSGQEINRGEAGLAEWGRALQQRFGHWDVRVSPQLESPDSGEGGRLFAGRPEGIHIAADPALHLDVNLRSYRAEALSAFVSAVLNLNVEEARRIWPSLEGFPLVMTRDLQQARTWLRGKQRGSRRIGLVASSGARRLRAEGLDVQTQLDVEQWFLNDRADVRSSFYLERPATEFGIQGLELDWTSLCWGGDLYPAGGQWVCRAFRGTAWQQVRQQAVRRFIINKYRVLLTRAREGTVIWVPPGDSTDPTRRPAVCDAVASYLAACGVRQLE